MLKINEIFGPTIQGEGPSQGREVMFLRLSYCNLSCTWCDTKYTWDWSQYDKTKEVHELSNSLILEKLVQVKALVISGGEPLLQQRQLLPLVQNLKQKGYWIEIESNGTIIPCKDLLGLIDQINCSPKLSNSGDTKEQRVKSKALINLSLSPKVYFKFVIGNEKDIEEVLEYVNDYFIKPQRVYLMPLGKTKDELTQITSLVRILAQQQGFNFSSRLHVELWGNKRAV